MPKHVIYAASGICPIKFSLFWELPSLPPVSVVWAWFWEVRNYGLQKGDWYTAEAIANWASEEYPMATEDFDYIYDAIVEYAEVINDNEGVD